jgi:methionine sulfoxide reductase heme-binding subunit
VTSNQLVRRVLKPAVFVVSLVPFVWLVWAVAMALSGTDLRPLRLVSSLFGYAGGLGADPLKDITNETGIWTLRFLCITLTITPIRRLTGWNAAVRFRRMLGLFAFFYGTLHLLVFIVFDRLAGMGFPSLLALRTLRDLASSIGGEIVKRPYITVGFTSWVCMLALAATSPAAMVRRLGGKRWRALHRLIYVAAIAGVLHFWWLVKADIREPAAYAVVVGILLLIRLVWALRARLSAPARVATAGRLSNIDPSL